MKPFTYNHNGGPPIEADDAPGLRVIRVHINDWVAATRGMSLDQEGFYWRFMCLFYDRMGTLTDDDRLVSAAMSLDIRTYRRMKMHMVATGKIVVEDRRLTNTRAEREITNYLAEYKRRSDAAKERERTKKIEQTSAELQAKIDATSEQSPAEVEPKSDELPAELEDDLFQKTNENNGCTATTVTTTEPQPSCARAFPKPKPKPKEREEEAPMPPEGALMPDPIDAAFEDFWGAFPVGRKQGKGAAKEIFRKIVTGRHPKRLRAKAETLVEAAYAYADTRPDPKYTPMPSTWLNEGRWEDDLTQKRMRAPATNEPPRISAEDHANAIAAGKAEYLARLHNG